MEITGQIISQTDGVDLLRFPGQNGEYATWYPLDINITPIECILVEGEWISVFSNRT